MPNELTTRNQTTPAAAATGELLQNAGTMLQLAEAVKDSSFIPAAMRGDAGNAFLAIELAGRTGLPLMATFQGMYVIEGRDGRSSGKPSFYANFIHALIRKSGAFVDTYYREGEDGTFNGQPNKTCQLVAVKQDGTEVAGPVISLAMAAKAGWSARNRMMWDAYTQTMLQNRAVTFFARQCCPELIFGIDPDAEVRNLADTDQEPESMKARLAQYARKSVEAEVIETEDEGVNYTDAAEVMKQKIEDVQKPRRSRKRTSANSEPEEEPETYAALGEFALWYANQIDAAETIETLEEIGKKIKKDFAGPEGEKVILRKLYAEKEAELNG